MFKTCVKCGIEKEYDDFHNETASEDGKKNVCKQCVSDNNATNYYWEKTNPESYREHMFSRKAYVEQAHPGVKYETIKKWMYKRGMRIGQCSRTFIDEQIQKRKAENAK